VPLAPGEAHGLLRRVDELVDELAAGNAAATGAAVLRGLDAAQSGKRWSLQGNEPVDSTSSTRPVGGTSDNDAQAAPGASRAGTSSIAII